jgi:AbiV family abortive infection protein
MDMTPRDQLDTLIRTRREAGVSQADLAVEIGTSQSALARVEAAGADPRLSTVERYGRALNAVLAARGTARPDTYSIDSIEELMEASFVNSKQLVDDARLLLEASRFPTAYLVAVLAAEEASKTLMLLRAGTDLALGNAVDWTDLRRRLADHGSKLGTLMLFAWAIEDQPAAWAAADLGTLLADSPGRRKAQQEAREALLLRQRASYVEIGPAGLSTPATAVRAEDARMMVTDTATLLLRMAEFGLPPPRGTFKRIARVPDLRRRATELRKALNRLPGVIPW